jgi:hypothetical protein
VRSGKLIELKKTVETAVEKMSDCSNYSRSQKQKGILVVSSPYLDVNLEEVGFK